MNFFTIALIIFMAVPFPGIRARRIGVVAPVVKSGFPVRMAELLQLTQDLNRTTAIMTPLRQPEFDFYGALTANSNVESL
ncbi:hypothetical protein ACIQWA_26190 [Kitasatospora sp. NPDC098652]|uniref:hypothetical protein n=1 Tax=Kitasatospora sp. NPDC098652 TaxID=3364095 RepID=UPI0037F5D6C6